MGDIYDYNDYELLYLARQNIEEGTEILLWKYSFLIKARIRQFKVPTSQYDDYLQEGNLMILEAIRIYDTNSKMSFTNFVDLLVKRRFITLLRKDRKFLVVNDDNYYDEIVDTSTYEEHILFEEDKCKFSPLEKRVFFLYYIENRKISEIAEILSLDSRSITNTKQRILKKNKNQQASIKDYIS